MIRSDHPGTRYTWNMIVGFVSGSQPCPFKQSKRTPILALFHHGPVSSHTTVSLLSRWPASSYHAMEKISAPNLNCQLLWRRPWSLVLTGDPSR
jgi:hypothetical protein